MDTKILFGGKVVVLGGDFRQTLPVVRSGKKDEFIQESLLCSDIWNQLEKLRLSVNMRARTDPAFCEYLMKKGSEKEKTNWQGFYASPCNMSSTSSRVIMTTTNNFVDEINDMLITQLLGDSTTYVAFDETTKTNDQSQYEDFLHSLHPAGLPPI
ncbi:uncharacterized protein LOC107831623 [Nicotiana tabacum]|uniref:ATP-dependent DNA helicase n=1 Tax=Nicotiana tabacum TaxID=4097 RepID=A0A1S4DNB2_TOBAC|nr:PREDICTED: uncharacterized protein LOC107831623 [Nicotiana tabacum]